jgi:hypothetical protein
MAHSVTLRLPTPLYERYRQRAEETRRSVEAELLDAVTAAAPEEERLPQDLADAISDLETLDDDALWLAAQSTFSPEASGRLEALHLKRQDEGLTVAEQEMAAQLVRQYERAMLVRAHAAKLLKQRGHDISELVARR